MSDDAPAAAPTAVDAQPASGDAPEVPCGWLSHRSAAKSKDGTAAAAGAADGDEGAGDGAGESEEQSSPKGGKRGLFSSMRQRVTSSKLGKSILTKLRFYIVDGTTLHEFRVSVAFTRPATAPAPRHAARADPHAGGFARAASVGPLVPAGAPAERRKRCACPSRQLSVAATPIPGWPLRPCPPHPCPVVSVAPIVLAAAPLTRARRRRVTERGPRPPHRQR